ncbi:PREDICTED: atrial natriuretic peptide receptor 1-like [Priapulus caudatus]|uniref:Atrial natriuretic peptide receptor 1-like n=1 Tax=Priapulus caudatus TaxID=37621 RepID=A0ABM1EPG0_PRICU|nr:PREDICTED: atrial natriuretic peptide receptor 1-like [Priapulus caudatus]
MRPAFTMPTPRLLFLLLRVNSLATTLALLSHIGVSDSARQVLRAGVLLHTQTGAPYDMERVGPAIDMAVEKVNRERLNASYTLEAVSIAYGNACKAANALGNAAKLYHDDAVVVFLGPACAHALEATGKLIGFWNLPVVTGVGDRGIFKFKDDYPTMTRLSYCQCRLRKVFGSVFRRFGWTHVAVLLDFTDVYAHSVGKTLEQGLRIAGMDPYVIEFDDSAANYTELLWRASDRARRVNNWEVNYFVGAFHDAVILYGMALNESLEAGLDIRDGFNVTRRMWDRKFQGITGEVYIDDNGDRDTDFSILDLNPDTGEFEVVANYYGWSPTYNEVQDVRWPAGRQGPPPDIPFCGFTNDNPACDPVEEISTSIYVSLGTVACLAVAAIVTYLLYRRKQLQIELLNMSWRIQWEELKFQRSRFGIGSLTSIGRLSKSSYSSTVSQQQVFANVANYKDILGNDCIHLDEQFCMSIVNDIVNAPVAGTQKGDIYSFAIILQEIALRSGPYESERMHLSVTDILEKVESGNTPQFRPHVPYDPGRSDIIDLMTSCWHDNPDQRPSFSQIHLSLRKHHKTQNIMDSLLTRMELYAKNLEDIVDQRTGQLVEEKKKVDNLLNEILPRSVAEQLKQGKCVQPESYESVTIYFSDIVGFTSICADSKPLQLRDLQHPNLARFIGICIDVPNIVVAMEYGAKGSLQVRHRPDEKLLLRIGIHTGPCVAGVVGMKMPRYCLFGDTVNTASRMESTGAALMIHISAATAELLGAFEFDVQLRGEVNIKVCLHRITNIFYYYIQHVGLMNLYGFSVRRMSIRIGMLYIHSSCLRSYGALRSSKCICDSRFVVKITGFGVNELREEDPGVATCQTQHMSTYDV